jgi:hypothetical protein
VELFSPFGETGRTRGLAFATMNTKDNPEAPTEAVNGRVFSGRSLQISESRLREKRSTKTGGDGRRQNPR